MAGPRVSGGMSFEDHQRLLMDERAHQAEQEEIRRQRAIEDEARRFELDAERREDIRREEELAIAELNDREQSIIDEIAAQNQQEKELSIDFFGSLFRGVTGQENPAEPRPT